MHASLVGRDDELALLLAAPDEATGSRIVLLTGEPGIGKTRLMSELARCAVRDGRRVLWSQMREDPAPPPLLPWTLALRDCVRDYHDATLLADVGSGAGEIARLVPELRCRLGLEEPDDRVDGEAARFRLFDAVACFLAAAANRQPLLLLLDNLQLADPSSLALLEHVAHAALGPRVTMVVAYRDAWSEPDGQLARCLERLSRVAGYVALALGGLDRNAVAELLQQRIGRAPGAAVVDAVLARSDGNPLFVVELARLLAGAGDLSAVRLPISLREVIDARLQSLPPSCQRLLGVAAVLGRTFDARTLATVSQSSPAVVLDALERAAAGGIIGTCNSHHRFSHALFREVLYARHSGMQRAALHLRTVEALETQPTGDPLGHLSQLAYHAFEAARVEHSRRIVAHCRRAGDAALQQRAYAEAALQFGRALQAAELASTVETDARFELLRQLGDALYHDGRLADASETQLKAALLAHHHRWWPRLADALIAFQRARRGLGLGHVAAVPLHETVLAELDEGDGIRSARLLASLALAQKQAGRRHAAEETALRAVAAARATTDADLLAHCLATADFTLCHARAAGTRLELAREADALGRRSDNAEVSLGALNSLLMALCDVGRIDEAGTVLVRLRDCASRERHPHYEHIADGFESAFAILRGDWELAIGLAEASNRKALLSGCAGLEGRFGMQMFAIQRARGLLGGVAALFARLVDDDRDHRLWLPGRILMHVELGHREEALAALHRLGDPAALADDDLRLTVLVYLAEACSALGDRQRSARLFDLLSDYRDVVACLSAALVHGAVAGFLAPLAAVTQRGREARRLFEQAIETNARMGAEPVLAQCRVDYATLLLGSPRRGDHALADELLADARVACERFQLLPLQRRIDRLAGRRGGMPLLSARELDVLRLLAAGASNRDIADALFVSCNTVASHVRNILRKTGTANRTGASDFARRHHLVGGT